MKKKFRKMLLSNLCRTCKTFYDLIFVVVHRSRGCHYVLGNVLSALLSCIEGGFKDVPLKDIHKSNKQSTITIPSGT